MPELQPEQLSPVLTNHRGSSCSPTPSMVASSHQVTLLLRLWDISSGTQILCTMRDLEHSVLFQKKLMLDVWRVRREDFPMPPILRTVLIQVFHTVFALNPENHCAVAHDPLRADKHILSFESRAFFLMSEKGKRRVARAMVRNNAAARAQR